MLLNKLTKLGGIFMIVLSQLFLGCNSEDNKKINTNVKSDSIQSDSGNTATIKISDSTSKVIAAPLAPIADTIKEDYPNSLVEGHVTLATPSWGDGKNGNDSFLDLGVEITTNDGQVYYGRNNVRNNSGIGPGNAIFPILTFSDLNKLNYDNISKVRLSMAYWKEDYQKDLRMDVWNVRAEVVLTFKDKSILATGYNEPATGLEFTDFYEHGQHRQWTFFTVIRSGMYSRPTLVPPYL